MQRALEARRPTRKPPRVVNGPTLLTGVAKCADCGGGMTIRTGKGGRYRYYSCNNRIAEGATSCKGRSIPMDVLDGIVLDQLESRVFAPDRLQALLTALLDRKANRHEDLAVKAKELRKQLRSTEEKIERLYAALAEGTVADTDLFRRSLAKLEQDREEQTRLAASLERRQAIPRQMVSKENLARFAAAASERLRASDRSLGKGYIRQFIDRIEVADDQIRIYGSKAALAEGLATLGKPGTSSGAQF